MAQNLLYIMEKEGPGTKFMVQQHNDHISNRPGHKTLGYNLHQMLGNKYYGIGFECYEGTFLARVLNPDGTWGDLKADTLLPVQKSLAWYLLQTSKKNYFINLHKNASNPLIDKWLETPIRFNNGSWRYRVPKKTLAWKR